MHSGRRAAITELVRPRLSCAGPEQSSKERLQRLQFSRLTALSPIAWGGCWTLGPHCWSPGHAPVPFPGPHVPRTPRPQDASTPPPGQTPPGQTPPGATARSHHQARRPRSDSVGAHGSRSAPAQVIGSAGGCPGDRGRRRPPRAGPLGAAVRLTAAVELGGDAGGRESARAPRWGLPPRPHAQRRWGWVRGRAR